MLYVNKILFYTYYRWLQQQELLGFSSTGLLSASSS